MTERALVYESAWFDSYRQLAKEDLVTARRIRAQVATLAADAAPASSTPWGDSGFRRLRIGEWRVLYEVDADMVRIWSLGRAP